MWGYEGEEIQDIEATIQHVKQSQPDIFFTTVAYPIKGTPYYEKVADRLVQLQPWGDSSIARSRSRVATRSSSTATPTSSSRKRCNWRASGEQRRLILRARAVLRQHIQASRAALLSSVSEVEA